VVVALVAWLVAWRGFLTPDVLFLALLVVAVAFGWTRDYVRKFAPFVLLLLSYDLLRGVAPLVGMRVHYSEMLNFDRWLGGGELPTTRLQALLYHGHLAWYDFYFYGLYLLHFVVPLLLAVLIWRTRPRYYWQFVWAIMALSYAAFVTFVLFPAAPPWIAAYMWQAPPMESLPNDIWAAMGVHQYPAIYAKLSPNLVAAVPSLHAAYPLLCVMWVWKLYGRRWGIPALVYPASIWFGVVYMGEHYVFDVLVGAVYAIEAFLLVPVAMRAVARLSARRRAGPQPQAIPLPAEPG
jgi:hypothetical protein